LAEFRNRLGLTPWSVTQLSGYHGSLAGGGACFSACNSAIPLHL